MIWQDRGLRDAASAGLRSRDRVPCRAAGVLRAATRPMRPAVPARWFGLLALVAYVLVSFRVGEFYPFSTMPMFSRRMRRSTRILARRADGATCDLDNFDRWNCPTPLDARTMAVACPNAPRHPEKDREAVEYLRTHAATSSGGEPVVVIRRTYDLPVPGGPMRALDCALGTCSAHPVDLRCDPTPGP